MASMFRNERSPAPPRSFQTSHRIPYPVFEVPETFWRREFATPGEAISCGQMAIIAARQAMRDADFDPADQARRRVGVCIGTTTGTFMSDEVFYRDFRERRYPAVEPVARFLRDNPAHLVARTFGFTGPCQTVTTACSSGTVAIGEAATWIASGLCDVVLAGGSEKLNRITYDGFAAMQLMDAQPCRPFDRQRKGLSLGEGAGLLLLESADSVKQRRARIRAFLLGYGNVMEACHPSAPRPDGAGLRQAIDVALQQSGLTVRDLSLINAHGTGTLENDVVEGCLYPELLPGVPFSATKGFTGHALGAVGAMEAAFAIACLEERRIPASIGFVEPDPVFAGRPVSEITTVNGRFALSVSSAFGGNNAALVVGLVEP